MCITGKGTGQGAAINPYVDKKSIAVVQNLGKNNFNVRIQYDGQIISDLKVLRKERKELQLEEGDELYLDGPSEVPSAKAQVTFNLL